MIKLTEASEFEEKLRRSFPLHHPVRHLVYGLLVSLGFVLMIVFVRALNLNITGAFIGYGFLYFFMLYRGSQNITRRYFRSKTFEWFRGRQWSRIYLPIVYGVDLLWMSVVHATGFTAVLFYLEPEFNLYYHAVRSYGPLLIFSYIFSLQLSLRSFIASIKHLPTATCLPTFVRISADKSFFDWIKSPIQFLMFILPILFILTITIVVPARYGLTHPWAMTFTVLNYIAAFYLIQQTELAAFQFSEPSETTTRQEGTITTSSPDSGKRVSDYLLIWKQYPTSLQRVFLARILVIFFLVVFNFLNFGENGLVFHAVSFGVFIYYMADTLVLALRTKDKDMFPITRRQMEFLYLKGIDLIKPVRMNLYLSLLPMFIVLLLLPHASQSTSVSFLIFLAVFNIFHTTKPVFNRSGLEQKLHTFVLILCSTTPLFIHITIDVTSSLTKIDVISSLTKQEIQFPIVTIIVISLCLTIALIYWTLAWIRSGNRETLKKYLFSEQQ